MKISASGFASPSWGAQLLAWEEMILNNTGQALAHTKAASATKPAGGGTKFKGGVEIHSQPNASGALPVHAGKVLLAPYFISGDSTLKLLDVAGATISNGPTVSFVNNTRNQWSLPPILLPDGRYLLVPAFQTHFAIYDPWSNTVSQGPASPVTGTSSIDAYQAATVGADGLVYLAQGINAVLDGGGTWADARLHILDPVANTLDSTTGPTMRVGTDYAAAFQFLSGHTLPDGSLFFNTGRYNGTGNKGPWRLTKSAAGSWSQVEFDHNAATDFSGNARGACITKDGKYLVLGSQFFNLIAIRLADNASVKLNSSAITGALFLPPAPLQDGRVLVIDQYNANVYAFDSDTLTLSSSLTALTGISGVTGVTAGSGNNFNGIIPLSDGGFILLPLSNPDKLVKYTPYSDGRGYPAQMRDSRFYARR